jgi:hypothetical protein
MEFFIDGGKILAVAQLWREFFYCRAKEFNSGRNFFTVAIGNLTLAGPPVKWTMENPAIQNTTNLRQKLY